jgi:uncharacterized membrane protein
MRNTKLLLAAALLLGLGACTNSAVEQSGGSGLESSDVGSAYSRSTSYSPNGSSWGPGDCQPDDSNCRYIYDSPGGGD